MFTLWFKGSGRMRSFLEPKPKFEVTQLFILIYFVLVLITLHTLHFYSVTDNALSYEAVHTITHQATA